MAHVTNKCIKLVKKFEGLYKKAYRDEVCLDDRLWNY